MNMLGNAHPTTTKLRLSESFQYSIQNPKSKIQNPKSKIQNLKSKIQKMLDPVDIKRDIQTLTDRLGKTQDYL
jgi:hypothetical protein